MVKAVFSGHARRRKSTATRLETQDGPESWLPYIRCAFANPYKYAWKTKKGWGLRGGNLSTVVDAFAQFFPNSEEGNALGGNRHGRTGFGVTTLSGLTMLDGKATKAADFNSVTTDQSLTHAVKHSVYDHFDVFFGDISSFVAHCSDQFALGHETTPFFGG